MIKYLIGIVLLMSLSSCSWLGGGFGSSDDEALKATVDYREPVNLEIPPESFQIMAGAFSMANFQEGDVELINDSFGALGLMFEFMVHKTDQERRLGYATYMVGSEFIEWVYLQKVAKTLDPLVLDGELLPKDSLLYYFISNNIRQKLSAVSENIYLTEKDIRGKASANDEAELRKLYKTFSPYISMMKGAIL